MIYFIQAGLLGPIKIGTVSGSMEKVKRRIDQLQVGCPAELTLIGVREGGVCEEMALHEQLFSSRCRGEWFWPTKEVLKAASESGSTPAIPSFPRYRDRYTKLLVDYLHRQARPIPERELLKHCGTSERALREMLRDLIDLQMVEVSQDEAGELHYAAKAVRQ